MLPSEYLALEQIERAFIIGSILVKQDEEKEMEKQAKRKSKGK